MADDNNHQARPVRGFLHRPQILGNAHADPPIPPLFPVSRSIWWAGVKTAISPGP
jgi:hypothetical protein